MSAVLRMNDAGDPIVTPFHYVPVVGFGLEAANQMLIFGKIKNLVSAEKEDSAKQIVRTPELTHLIGLSTHFWEEGQKRSLLSIALCIVALVAFPHSFAVAIFAGTFLAITILACIDTRRIIAAQAKVLQDLKGKTTFGDEILRGLRIQRH
ncbi:MAG TPA: hypothetical protein VLG76_06970 [Rhabdochlamydiaceae bacterium]|nr:hypothetical protein [Rhabdochlamydiaceae bacterium]